MGTRGIRSGRSIRVTALTSAVVWRGWRRRLAGAARASRGDVGSCDDAATHQPPEGDEETGPETAERWQQGRQHGRLHGEAEGREVAASPSRVGAGRSDTSLIDRLPAPSRAPQQSTRPGSTVKRTGPRTHGEILAMEQNRAAVVAGYRLLADLLEKHPELPIPYHGPASGTELRIYMLGSDRAAFVDAVRALPGRLDKSVAAEIGRAHV